MSKSNKFLSDLSAHTKRFKNCSSCGLCEYRTNVVEYRGQPNPQLLFVGEAPGSEEDRIGVPFVGPAGQELKKLLNDIKHHIENVPSPVIPDLESIPMFSYGIINTLGCIPKDSYIKKFRTPTEEEIESCLPRFESLVRLCKPIAFVALGAVAEKFLFNSIPNIEKSSIKYDWDFAYPATYLLESNFKKQKASWIAPIHKTYHPSYIIRQETESDYQQARSRVIAGVSEFWRAVCSDSQIPF